MKTIFSFICLISLLSTINVQALTKIPVSKIYQIEDHLGNSYDIRDLQDGFIKINGLKIINQSLLINLNSLQNINIQFYNGKSLKSSFGIFKRMSGGDMGGG